MMKPFAKSFLNETVQLIQQLNPLEIDQMALALAAIRNQDGRLFILGVGGSAGHASHAVNDFRKICQFEAYSPTDNVSELTARINDSGWETCMSEWLKGSRLNAKDALLIFSVGGGDVTQKISMNLVRAIEYAQQMSTSIFGIVGKEGGYTKKFAHHCILIPPLVKERITPHTEGLTAVLWHLLVSHPALNKL